eukprot:10358065-Karenia_brevis.AAC.1
MCRLPLPARLHGGCLRSLGALCRAACSATQCKVLPRMIDGFSVSGEGRLGCLPMLVSLLGPG